jgi:hypothetical protein
MTLMCGHGDHCFSAAIQGMGMIVGTLMMQMPTEQAFWSMTALMDPGLGVCRRSSG